MLEDITYLDDRWYDLENLLHEEWRDVKGFEGLYQVSNYGRVKRLAIPYRKYKLGNTKGYYPPMGEYIVNTSKAGGGYIGVYLVRPGHYGQNGLNHILVAQAFIPNPNSLPVVNHIDGDKTNSKIFNLEWCTYQDNSKHAVLTGLSHMAKPVLQFDLDGNFITEYHSIREASIMTNIYDSSISSCCLGKSKTAGGFVWKYKNQENT